MTQRTERETIKPRNPIRVKPASVRITEFDGDCTMTHGLEQSLRRIGCLDALKEYR